MLTSFEAVAPFSALLEEMQAYMRGYRGTALSCAIRFFPCICSSHFYSIMALLGQQEGEHGKLKVTAFKLTREALLYYIKTPYKRQFIDK